MTGALSGTFFRFLLMCLGRWRPEPEAVPGETVRLFVGWHFGCGSLVGCVRLQRFLHRSASRNTVRTNVLFSRAGAGRLGCFRQFLVCGYRRRTKRGGSYGLAPPLCIGSRGCSSDQTASVCFATFSGTCESRACRAAVSFWVRNGGLFRNRCWASILGPPVVRKNLRRLNNGATFLVQLLGHGFGKLLACGD